MSAEPSAGDELLVNGPHAFVGDLDDPQLDADDRHHFARVLRVRVDDPISVSDGRGRWRACRFGDELAIEGAIVEQPRPSPPLTVGFALVKGGRPELVVQKLTELGIDRIVPFVAERSVVRWDDERARKHHERLTKVALEASMQCKRCHLPQIGEVRSFRALVDELGGAVTLADRLGRAPSLRCATVLIGPEGGWSIDERSIVAETTAFGDHVLRSETAAISAASVMVAMRSGLVQTNN